MSENLKKIRFAILFLAFALLIFAFKYPYFDFPLIWDETQLLKPAVANGEFWRFIPPFNEPFSTYGHPSGVAFFQSLFTFVFGASNIALRFSSLIMSSLALTTITYAVSRKQSFSLGVVTSLMLFFSPLYFPSVISYLPQSFELIGGMLLLAITFNSREKRNPYSFANLSILAIFLRETNIAFWVPYSLIHLWNWIKKKSSFPYEILVAPVLLIFHFGFNKLKTGFLLPHPLLINNQFKPQNTFGEMFNFTYEILRDNTLYFVLILLMIVSFFFLLRKSKEVVNELFPISLPLVLHLGFYVLYYRDFGHRDYIPSLCLIFMMCSLSLSKTLDSIEVRKYLQAGVAAGVLFLLFLSPSFHGKLFKKQYFRVQTKLYQKTIEFLEEKNLDSVPLYAPWPLSHALLSPIYNWTDESYMIVGKPENALYSVVTDSVPGQKYFNLEEREEWQVVETIEEKGLTVKILRRTQARESSL